MSAPTALFNSPQSIASATAVFDRTMKAASKRTQELRMKYFSDSAAVISHKMEPNTSMQNNRQRLSSQTHPFSTPTSLIVSLSQLAKVEVQSIMQYLDQSSLLRLGRCSRILYSDSLDSLCWKHRLVRLELSRCKSVDESSFLSPWSLVDQILGWPYKSHVRFAVFINVYSHFINKLPGAAAIIDIIHFIPNIYTLTLQGATDRFPWNRLLSHPSFNQLQSLSLTGVIPVHITVLECLSQYQPNLTSLSLCGVTPFSSNPTYYQTSAVSQQPQAHAPSENEVKHVPIVLAQCFPRLKKQKRFLFNDRSAPSDSLLYALPHLNSESLEELQLSSRSNLSLSNFLQAFTSGNNLGNLKKLVLEELPQKTDTDRIKGLSQAAAYSAVFGALSNSLRNLEIRLFSKHFFTKLLQNIFHLKKLQTLKLYASELPEEQEGLFDTFRQLLFIENKELVIVLQIDSGLKAAVSQENKAAMDAILVRENLQARVQTIIAPYEILLRTFE